MVTLSQFHFALPREPITAAVNWVKKLSKILLELFRKRLIILKQAAINRNYKQSSSARMNPSCKGREQRMLQKPLGNNILTIILRENKSFMQGDTVEQKMLQKPSGNNINL